MTLSLTGTFAPAAGANAAHSAAVPNPISASLITLRFPASILSSLSSLGRYRYTPSQMYRRRADSAARAERRNFSPRDLF
jgi:hypothetical protein